MWPPLRYAVVMIMSTLLLPPCRHNATYRRCIDACVFVGWRRLASYRVTYHRAIMPSQQYIVAEFPHGVRVSACVGSFPSLARLQETRCQDHPQQKRLMLAVLNRSLNRYQPLVRIDTRSH